jgi:hypothetical protein
MELRLFICLLMIYFTTVSSSNHVTSWPDLNCYPGVCLEGLRKPRITSVKVAGPLRR